MSNFPNRTLERLQGSQKLRNKLGQSDAALLDRALEFFSQPPRALWDEGAALKGAQREVLFAPMMSLADDMLAAYKPDKPTSGSRGPAFSPLISAAASMQVLASFFRSADHHPSLPAPPAGEHLMALENAMSEGQEWPETMCGSLLDLYRLTDGDMSDIQLRGYRLRLMPAADLLKNYRALRSRLGGTGPVYLPFGEDGAGDTYAVCDEAIYLVLHEDNTRSLIKKNLVQFLGKSHKRPK